MTLASSMHTALHLDHYDLNIGKNNTNHHTELFGEEQLIVRRGEPFNITLHVKTDSGRFALDDKSFFLIAETGMPLGCKRATMMLHFLS